MFQTDQDGGRLVNPGDCQRSQKTTQRTSSFLCLVFC